MSSPNGPRLHISGIPGDPLPDLPRKVCPECDGSIFDMTEDGRTVCTNCAEHLPAEETPYARPTPKNFEPILEQRNALHRRGKILLMVDGDSGCFPAAANYNYSHQELAAVAWAILRTFRQKCYGKEAFDVYDRAIEALADRASKPDDEPSPF